MKARVKGTGEIVDVHPIGDKMMYYRCANFATGDGRELLSIELDLLPNIDWEQRRYEIAKDVLAASFEPMSAVRLPTYAHICVQCADALIYELKKTKK